MQKYYLTGRAENWKSGFSGHDIFAVRLLVLHFLICKLERILTRAGEHMKQEAQVLVLSARVKNLHTKKPKIRSQLFQPLLQLLELC